jgi:hypothetical protein
LNKRISSLPVLVVVAVVALVLGSFGTATAAGLTKGSVKKIATKVVNKKASTLSVAHATTADTATNAISLNAKPASAYQTQSYRYRLPVQTGAVERSYSFPGLPAGTYLFTYSVVAVGATAPMFCHMRPNTSFVGSEGFQYATVSGSVGTISASGIVDATSTANLRCSGGASFTIYGGSDVASSVTFTRVDALTGGTSTAPRGTAPGSGSGLTN